MNVKNTALEGFEVSFVNHDEYLEIAKEVFVYQEYQFSSEKSDPTIIDCGSHIGLATLYFKKLFPQSKITCIEPIPESFGLLQRNIEMNQLESVQLLNAAISDEAGQSVIFGEFEQENPRHCGSSLCKDWANPGSVSIPVETIVLSSLLNETVDFVKLDIEGMEWRVLKEIEPQIHKVGEFCIEFHGMNQLDNELEDIIELLERNNFQVSIRHKDIENIFPTHLLSWVQSVSLSLAVIKAKNIAFA